MLQLKKFPEIPVSTQEEERGSRPHPEELRFRLQAKDEGSFPASSRVETGMSGNFLRCSKGVKDSLEVPEVKCD